MTSFEILDDRSLDYIGSFGVDITKVVAVTNWLDLVAEPDNIELLFRVQRRIFRDPTRIAFLVREGDFAAIFATVAEGYIRLSDGKVFWKGEWVEND